MAVQIYYQLIRDIVIDEQLLSMLQPQRRKQLFSFRLESDQKRCAAAGLLIINIQNASLSLTMHQGSLV